MMWFFLATIQGNIYFSQIEDVEIFNLQRNHVTFTAFSKDLLNARFPCSTASLTLKESQPQQDTSGSHEGLQGFPIKHVMVRGVGVTWVGGGRSNPLWISMVEAKSQSGKSSTANEN